MDKPNFDFENNLKNQGLNLIAGIDEVGRGSWAGPVVASAVIFPIPKTKSIPLLDDSKKLTHKQRKQVLPKIKSLSLSYSLGIIDVEIIDKIGIGKANKLAFLRAIMGLKQMPDYILLDYFKISTADLFLLYKLYPQYIQKRFYLEKLINNQQGIKFGDNIVASISAASIIAKVYRDNLMIKLHKKHPLYNFKKNKGYPSLEHRNALKTYGPCLVHRKSFKPINQLQMGL